MIPSSVNLENKAVQPDIVIRNKKRKKLALLIEVLVPSDFGLNDTEIKTITKYQDLKNEVKRPWNQKSAKFVPVIIGAW